jgi:malate synthase
MNQIKEHWMELCALAAQEQDPVKLLKLTEEICRQLEERQQKLNAEREAERQRASKELEELEQTT